MFLLYNLLLTLTSPVWAPYTFLKSRKRKEQPNWKERMGSGYLAAIPAKGERPRIWVHAVSVGEVIAAKPILEEIRKQLPQHEIVLSVTTSSGHQTARQQPEGLYDFLVYFPLDVPRFQMVAMQRVRPDAVLVMETELWMNFLWAAKVFGALTFLVNGRISDRSYPRSVKLKAFYKSLLSYVDRCLMQSQTDVDRILSLGAKSAEVLGNVKFDQALEETKATLNNIRQPNGKATLVIGSTRGVEEEQFVLGALELVGFDRLNVIHAPRHLETAPGLAEAVKAKTGAVALRSKDESGPYLILDTYGELAKTYALADFTIIGGGFSNLGGQNLLQPLAHGKPVLHGPHMQNFRDVATMADRSGAALTCSTPQELAEAIRSLLDNPDQVQKMGKAASQLIKSNLGASQKMVAEVAKALAKKPIRKK